MSRLHPPRHGGFPVSPFPIKYCLSPLLCRGSNRGAARRGALCRYAPNTCVCSFPFLIESLRRPRTLAETVPQGFTKTKSNKIASLATRFRIKERNCVRLYDLNDTKDSEKPKLQREGKGQAEANERETRNERRETSDPAHEALRLLNLPLPFVCCAGEGGKVVVF